MNYISLIFSIVILVTTFIIVMIFQRFFNRFILKSTLVAKGDPTNYRFLKHTISAVIYIVGIGVAIYQIEGLRTLASGMLAGAGIFAVAIGFASQQALSNIVGGIFIIVFKPYGINDRIVIKDTLRGVVEDITLRHTVIKDYENRRIVIPNSVISNEVVINSDLNDERICRLIEMGISYDSNIKLAKSIMEEESLKHPLQIDQRTPEQKEEGIPEVQVRVISMGESSVNLRAWVWAKDQADGFAMQCDLLESIKERFDTVGIEIPFPHRTLVFKNNPDGEFINN